MTKRTLVVHTGGLGDFLLACPSIQQLDTEGPVELLGNQERLALAVAGGIAERAASLDSADFGSILTNSTKQLRAYLKRFDRAVVWMRDEDGQIARTLSDCGIETVHVNAGIPPKEWSQHASLYYTTRLNMPRATDFSLAITPAKVQVDILIHPGSGSNSKNWPLQSFLRLAHSLEERGRAVRWCLGPAEREREEIQTAINEELTVYPETPLALARVLRATQHYIGNDSGVSHLAAAVGCPTTVLFGPTDPAVWAPRGSHVHAIDMKSDPSEIIQRMV